jgi:hypothetical protein
MKLPTIGLLSAVLAVGALPMSAAIILTGSYDTSSRAFYTPSSSDLINGLTPTTTYVAKSPDGGAISVLTDGSVGLSGATAPAYVVFGGDFNTDGSPNFQGQAGGVGWRADYTLTGSATGYDITAFNVYTGHNDTRVNQNYRLFVQTVSSGGSWIQIGGDFAYNPNTGGGGNQSAFTSVTENTTGIVATGVTGVRLQTLQAVAYGAAMYREFDVIGTASAIPEPSTYAAVFGILALGLAAHRRRRAR